RSHRVLRRPGDEGDGRQGGRPGRQRAPAGEAHVVGVTIARPGKLGGTATPSGDSQMAREIDDQLTKYLTDAHSIEEQALAQLRTAPDLAGDPEIAAAFDLHRVETERHEAATRRMLDDRGASPSKVKDVVMAVGGKGFVLFARSQPDTPG